MRGFGLSSIGTVWVVAVMLSFAVVHASAKKVTVKLTDGRVITGELVSQSDKKITLKISGVELSLDRDKVASLTDAQSPQAPSKEPTLLETFTQKRSAIADSDFIKRYALCTEYFQIGKNNTQDNPAKASEAYRLALDEIRQMVKAKPDSLPYKILEAELTKRLAKLDTSASANPSPKTPQASTPLISDDQLNMLWIYETDPKNRAHQRGIRKMSHPAVEQLFEDARYRTHTVLKPFLTSGGLTKFKQLQGHQQLELLFQLQARDHYAAIKVSEPPHFKPFVNQIHDQYLIRHCGACHAAKAPQASPEALKALTLFTRRSHPRASKQQLAYTNYMVLTETTAGPFYVIDRNAPQQSPLLNFGVAATSSQRPHPEVKNLKPFFRAGANQKSYQDILGWINKLYPGKYPFRLSPVKPEAAPVP